MGQSNDQPILSSLADDPAEGEAIDAFVLGLAERVDALQDCEARGALAPLLASVSALAEDADKVGFDLLARVARSIGDACDANAADAVRKALVELTEIARRVRLGHRGAV